MSGREKLRCLSCGKWYRNLRQHVANAHGHDSASYRGAFGLAKDEPLDPPDRRGSGDDHEYARRLAYEALEANRERWRERLSQAHGGRPTEVRVCASCGASFESRKSRPKKTCSRECLRELSRKIARKPRGARVLSEEQKDRIISRANAGEPKKALAREYGVNAYHVYKLTRERGPSSVDPG